MRITFATSVSISILSSSAGLIKFNFEKVIAMSLFKTISMMLTSLVFASCSLTAAISNAQTISVHGFVNGLSKNGEPLGPIPGAQVEFLDSDGNVAAQGSTNDQGYYRVIGVPASSLEYRISAPSFRTENAGRKVDVRQQLESQKLDFALVQGQENSGTQPEPAVVRVWKFEQGRRVAVDDATVSAREISTGQLMTASKEQEDTGQYRLSLPAGEWKVSAAVDGLPPVVDTEALSISTHATASGNRVVELVFRTQDSLETQTVRALVSVQRAKQDREANSDSLAKPTITFHHTGMPNETFATDLIPVSEEDLRFLAADDQNENSEKQRKTWDWYWANSQGPLPVAEYFTQARLAGLEPFQTAPLLVESNKTTVFHVKLKQHDQLGSLMGLAAREVAVDTVEPLAGWRVIAVEMQSGESRMTTTDSLGEYQLRLDSGNWWVHAEAPAGLDLEVKKTKPVSVTVVAGGKIFHDITIATRREISLESSHLAIVGVKQIEGRESIDVPDVQFHSAGETSTELRQISGQTDELTERQLEDLAISASLFGEGKWKWYLSTPVQELTNGMYSVRATLDGYQEKVSRPASIMENESTYFHLTLMAPTAPGRLIGNVVNADSDSDSTIEQAHVEVWNENLGRFELTFHDSQFTLNEISPGLWWVAVTAKGFEPSQPTLVTLREGVDAEVLVRLTPLPKTPPAPIVTTIVGVEGTSRQMPTVELVSITEQGESSMALKVDSVDYAWLRANHADVGIDPNWTYYSASPTEPINPGKYWVRSSASEFLEVASDAKEVRSGFETRFELDLFAVPAPLTSQTIAIHGRVYGMDEAGNSLGWVNNASISFLNELGTVVGSARTDAQGYYQLKALSIGRLYYRVEAAGYRIENAGRAIELEPSEHPHVVDFTLTKGERFPWGAAHLEVSVWEETADGNQTRIPNATIMIRRSAETDEPRIGQVSGESDYELDLDPGTYWISASAIGFGNAPAQAVEVKALEQMHHRVVLRRMVGEVRVLVRVERNSNDSARIKPEVTLLSSDLEQVLKARVEPIVGDELRQMSRLLSESDQQDWYWGSFEQSIALGSYFAMGKLEGFQFANSAMKTLQAGSVEVFHLVMKQLDEQTKLSGTVYYDSVESRNTPFEGVVIRLENLESGQWHEVSTDTNGEYSLALEPGRWWARVASAPDETRLQIPSPLAIELNAGDQAKQDFRLALKPDNQPVRQLAKVVTYVAVLSESDSDIDSNIAPRFRLRHGSGQVLMPRLEKLADTELQVLAQSGLAKWVWYRVEMEVEAGEVYAEAFADGLDSNSTPWTQVHEGTTTHLLLLLVPTAKERKGGLQVEVLIADSFGKSRAEQAQVYLSPANANQLAQSLTAWDGLAQASELTPGVWWIYVQVEGCLSPNPIPIQILPGKQHRSTVELKRLPKPRPTYPTLVYLNAHNVGTCSIPDAPTVTFILEAEPDQKEYWEIAMQSDRFKIETVSEPAFQPDVAVTHSAPANALGNSLPQRTRIDATPRELESYQARIASARKLPKNETPNRGRLNESPIPQHVDESLLPFVEDWLSEKQGSPLRVSDVVSSRYDVPSQEFRWVVEVSARRDVPAIVELQSDSSDVWRYVATPVETLEQGIWRVETVVGQQLVDSQVKRLNPLGPTVIQVDYELPSTSSLVQFSAWDADKTSWDRHARYEEAVRKRDAVFAPGEDGVLPTWTSERAAEYDELNKIVLTLEETIVAGASVTLFHHDSHSTIQFRISLPQQLEPGEYSFTVTAPGFMPTEMREVTIACEARQYIHSNLRREFEATRKTKLFALVQVSGQNEPPSAPSTGGPYYAFEKNNTRTGKDGFQFVSTHASSLASVQELNESRPTVLFFNIYEGKRGKSYTTNLRELTKAELDENGIAVESSDRWYWAESRELVPEGFYEATASLEGFPTAVANRKSASVDEPILFHLRLASDQSEDGQGSLAFEVFNASGDGDSPVSESPIGAAIVTIRNVETGQVLSEVVDFSGRVQFENLSGHWTASAACDTYQSYRHPNPIYVTADRTDTFRLPLMPLAPEQLGLPQVKILVAIEATAQSVDVGVPRLIAHCAVPKTVSYTVVEEVIIDGKAVAQTRIAKGTKWADYEVEINSLQPASSNQLRELGIDPRQREQPLRWYLGELSEPLPVESKLWIAAELPGYLPARSKEKLLLADSIATLDVWMPIPTSTLLIDVEQGPQSAPASGVTVSVWSSELGQSPLQATKATTDRDGKVSINVRGLGEYKILVSGTGFEPQSDVLQVASSEISRTIHVGEAIAGATFVQGIVFPEGGSRAGIPTATIKLTPIDQRNAPEPILVECDRQGRFRFEQVPFGQYLLEVNADGYETWSRSRTVDRGIAPIDIALRARNNALEDALYLLLTQGWEDSQLANGFYRKALQVEPNDPIVDYAMALVQLRANQAANGLNQLANANRKSSERFPWDRSLDTRIWVLLDQQDTSSALAVALEYSTHFQQRSANPASLEFAELIGIWVGLCKTTWSNSMTALDQQKLQRAIESNFNDLHRDAYQRGINSILGEARTGKPDPNTPNRDAAIREAQSRIDEIDAQLKTKRNEIESLVAEYQKQIERLRTEFNPRQRELDQQTREKQQKETQLKTLRSQGRGESEAANDLTHEIIELSLRIRQLQQAKATVDTEITQVTQRQSKAESSYSEIYETLIAERRDLVKKIETLSASGVGAGGREGTQIASFRDLNLETRRQELLNTLDLKAIKERTPVSNDPGTGGDKGGGGQGGGGQPNQPRPVDGDPNNSDPNNGGGQGDPAVDPKLETYHSLIELGIEYYDGGRFREAEETFSDAIKLLPQLAQGFQWRARARRELQSESAAIQDYGTAIRIEPRFFDCYVERGRLQANGGRTSHAIEDFSVALNIRPDEAQVLFDRGVLLKTERDYRKAATDLSRVIELVKGIDAELEAKAYAHLAEIAYLDRKFDITIKLATRAVERNERFGYAFRMLALGHMGKTQYVEAITALDQAVRLDPNDLIAWHNRSKCHRALGNLEQALADIETCIRLRPRDVALITERNLILQLISERNGKRIVG